jgi:hypothetical protein
VSEAKPKEEERPTGYRYPCGLVKDALFSASI